jgi:hypothetical protein
MSVVLKRATVLAFAIPGLFILFSYYTGIASREAATLITWPVTLATFSVILGVITFVRYHLVRVTERAERWQYNVLAIGSFVFTFVLAFVAMPAYDYVISNVVIVLTISFSSFFGFYNLTLFYQATRVRTAEVGLLLVSAILVMLWMAPIGEVLWVGFPVVGKWINDIPSGGAMRGILIGIAVGMIGLFIRSILGYERAYVGG